MNLTEKVDEWIKGEVAALVLREYLIPSEGRDSPFFPPTFAGTGSKNSSYCIDTMKDGTQTCLIDTVGSQANRMEPMFTKPPYSQLVPQVVIEADKKINLCDVGHRAADALLRNSSIRKDIQNGLRELANGNPIPLAKIAPTSFVFGLWDSRGTGTKLPRVVSSVIRAYDIDQFTRSAQYSPLADYRNENLLKKPNNTKENDARSELGFNEAPATNTHGGIVAHGDIRRDTVVNFAALRKIVSNEDELSLQRYILSLSILAATYNADWYLRQGCLLTRDLEKGEPKWALVYPDGRREDVELDHTSVLEFAKKAADEFVIGEDLQAKFDREHAKNEIADKIKSKNK